MVNTQQGVVAGDLRRCFPYRCYATAIFYWSVLQENQKLSPDILAGDGRLTKSATDADYRSTLNEHKYATERPVPKPPSNIVF